MGLTHVLQLFIRPNIEESDKSELSLNGKNIAEHKNTSASSGHL